MSRNPPGSEINSISANVRVSPMPQPPSYDFATKNLEPVGNGIFHYFGPKLSQNDKKKRVNYFTKTKIHVLLHKRKKIS